MSNLTPKMSIRWNLKLEMARADLSVTDLAEKTGLSYSTISKLRNRIPSRLDMDTLNALCEVLNCKVGDLVEYVSDRDAA
jgi:putative transcriptional regulator